MPCTKELQVDTKSPVMVTGATGYVAGVLISRLLDHGLTVHATVRDPSKKDRIQYLQDKADESKGTIRFFAGNLLKEGSFDEGAKGCSVIFHTASPCTRSVKDVDEDLLMPAVKGTENILATADKTPTIERVVLTSSVMAIYNHASDLEDTPNGVWTEAVWNRNSSKLDSPYSLSKTMAEQKAWVMAGSQCQWKLVVVNPSVVMGPGLRCHTSSLSFQIAKELAESGSMGLPTLPMAVVDVRDVADAHIAAAFIPEASGRHIISGSNTDVVTMAKAMVKSAKEILMPKVVQWIIAPFWGLTRHYVKNNVGYKVNFDNSKARSELGIDFYPLDKTMRDMLKQLEDSKAI